MRLARPSLAVGLLFVCLVCPYSPAQQITGAVNGRVVDSLGHPVPGANITIQGANIQGIRGCVSDERGAFMILGVPPGRMLARIGHSACQQVTVSDLFIQLGRITDVGEVRLLPRTHSMPELVVTGARSKIDPGTTYGSNLLPSDFDNLPVDRNYRGMVSLLPQVNLSFFGDGVNIGGATGLENKYFADGVEVTDPLIGGTGTSLPYNIIQEIEVKAGGYEAEFRSAMGGVINAVTYSGTNEFHGSVFGFYTSNKFSGDKNLGLLDPTQGDFSNYDIGFNLGGPIVRDRLWMFAAYNPTFNSNSVIVPGFGNSVQRILTHSFAAKLTWTASSAFRALLTATGDPTVVRAVGFGVLVPPAALLNSDRYFYDIRVGGYNFAFNGTYTFRENLFLEITGSSVSRDETGEPSTKLGKEEPFFNDHVTGAWSGGGGTSWDSFRYCDKAGLKINAITGAHVLKAWLSYKMNSVTNQYDIDNIDKYDDTTYSEYIGKGFGDVGNQTVSAFVQDKFRVLRGLTINAGVRWDGQSIIGSNGAVVQRIFVPLEPRLGFTFLPSEDGSQRIFGSFGRFCQEFALFQSTNYHSDAGYDIATQYDHDPRISRSGGTVTYNGIHAIRPEVAGLRGQYYDEFSIGYERSLGKNIRATIQGLYRTLREAIDDVYLAAEGRYQFGNPGRGLLADWPRPRREYTAMVVTVERHMDERFNFLMSYVLSSNYGDYEGLFDAFNHGMFPNGNATFDDLSTARENTNGLLPNDRTHVFKFAGSYRFSLGLTAGITFGAESGTPLSQYAYTDAGIRLLTPRGSAGRTPAFWDLAPDSRMNFLFHSFRELV